MSSDLAMEAASGQLEALGSTIRLQVVRELVKAGGTGLPVAALQARLGIAASTLSHHLRKLVHVGLIRQERDGTTLFCHAEYAAIRALAEFLVSECCVDENKIPET